MAIKFLAIASVLAATVLTPVHSRFGDDELVKPKEFAPRLLDFQNPKTIIFTSKTKPQHDDDGHAYLWIHLIFVYIFSGLFFYLLYTHTLRVIRVRQDYLGHQCTITDRTIRVSGIPPDMRSEEAIKRHVEEMGIGTVDSVTIIRDWKVLDNMMQQRDVVIRRLEEAWTVYLSRKRIQRSLETLPIVQPDPPSPRIATDSDTEALLDGHGEVLYNRKRPQLTIRRFYFAYGTPRLSSKKVDAIDHYTMKLEDLDAKIEEARKQEFRALPIAFVTLNSVAAAQMAVQAVLDPKPAAFVARPAPAPSNIIWRNTYMPRYQRMLRSWSISIFIFVLTVVWLIPVGILAGMLNIKSIRKVWPQLADFLQRSTLAESLISNFLPTAILTLLNVAVPYLYDYLSNLQGMISQAEVELSVISKNFFFTFFNLFFAFSVFGTASEMYSVLKDSLKDTTHIAYLLAQSLQALAPFYINLIVLQGLGMFPFRLLDFGSVALYPFMRVGAKTPRDYDKLLEPSTFSYGFFLPQPILILILCIVYSVLPSGTFVLAFGLLYFLIGYFTHKYQLLYAMDHPQHSTGQAWSMITYRLLTGVVLFQSAMAGWLALRSAYIRALLIIPLIAVTFWFTWFYRKTFSSLNRYIALRAITDDTGGAGTRSPRDPESTVAGMTVDERREQDHDFINPNMIIPLNDAWVKKIGHEYSFTGIDTRG